MRIENAPKTGQPTRHHRLLKALLVALGVFVVVLLIAPFVIIPIATIGPIAYDGNTDLHPLQDIYTPEEFGILANERMLITEDGYSIWTSEVSVPVPKAIVIYLTGIQQPSVTYFYPHAKWMQENGYASLLLEVRGHGNSSGVRVCLGYEETRDVQAAVSYLKGQTKYADVPIVLHGVSMGGAIAINAFGQLPEVDGLIAMSAYSSFEDVVCDTMAQHSMPSPIIALERPLLRLASSLLFGKSIVEENTPLAQIQNIGERPALLIASEGDTSVPSVNMQRLLAVAPEHTQSWLLPSDAHFIVKDNDFSAVRQDTEYCKRILDFLEDVVSEQKTTNKQSA